MREIRSDELDSHVNFKVLNGKECNADFYCFLRERQHSIFVNKVKKRFCSLFSTNLKKHNVKSRSIIWPVSWPFV